MKISALNVSRPVSANSRRLNNKQNNGMTANQTKQNVFKNEPYKPSFGFDPFILGLYGVYMLFYAGAVVVANRKIHYDEMESELAAKKVAEEEQKKLNDISNTYGISINEAKEYQWQFLKRASIPQKCNGDEIGMNAVMGYEFEKYKLAMDVIVPVVNAQNGDTNAKVPNGVILYGPPGGGKTYIADKLGEHLQYFHTNIEDIDFSESNHEENVEKIVKAFTDAEENFKETGKYTLIRLPEDIDLTLVDRNRKDAAYTAETAAMIKYAENCSQRGAIWLSTANNPRNIDNAILRPGRADVKIPIGNMKDYAVADMIRYSLYRNGEEKSVGNFNYKKVTDTMNEKKYVHTPYELEYFVMSAKAHKTQPDANLNADMVIAEMVDYNENDFPVLDSQTRKKFKQDQNFMESTKTNEVVLDDYDDDDLD